MLFFLLQMINLLVLVMIVLLLRFKLDDFLCQKSKLESADAIVILSGETYQFHRTRHAITLLDKQLAKRFIFGSSVVLDSLYGFSLPRRAAQLLMQEGVDSAQIYFSSSAMSTVEEAEQLLVVFRKHAIRKIILVTDDFHVRRAVQSMKHADPDLSIISSPSSNARFDLTKWWREEDGFITVMNECMKIFYYWIKFGIHPL
jgi:uncharacterized SAM-binding protein YcdF (DUF218 family)